VALTEYLLTPYDTSFSSSGDMSFSQRLTVPFRRQVLFTQTLRSLLHSRYRGAKYCDERIRMSVCLSAGISRRTNFAKFFCAC